jgi:hypothetical protein
VPDSFRRQAPYARTPRHERRVDRTDLHVFARHLLDTGRLSHRPSKATPRLCSGHGGLFTHRPTTRGRRYGSMKGLTSHHSNHLWVISRENRQLSSTIILCWHCLAARLPKSTSAHLQIISRSGFSLGRFLQWRFSSILVWQVQVQLQQCNFTSGRALSRAHSAVISSTMPCRNL